MKIKNLFYFLLALPLVFAACDGDEPIEEPKAPVLALTSEATLNFGASGGEATVTYTLENPVEGQEITATADVNWISDFVCGENIKFTVAENTALEARVGKVTVAYSTLSFEVTVNQSAATAPDLVLKSASEAEFEAEGGAGEFEYELSNPVEGTELKATANVDWITDVAAANNKVTYKVAANDKAEAREGRVTLTYGELKVEVAVKQKALVIPDPELTLKSEATKEFAAEGGNGEFEYELKNAVEGTELVAAADVAWITEVAAADGKVTYTVAANDKAESREGKVTLTYGELKVEVTVKQAAKIEENKPALNLKSETTKEFTAAGGDGEFAYELINPVEGTELKAAVAADVKWITDVKVDAEKSKVTYKVVANDKAEAREAKVTLTYGELKAEVTVKQAGALLPELKLKGEAELVVKAKGGKSEFEFELLNPVEGTELEAVADVEWITSVKVNDSDVSFRVDQNVYSTAREGKVTLTYGELSVAVTVKQEGAAFKFEVQSTKMTIGYEGGLNFIFVTLEGLTDGVKLAAAADVDWITDFVVAEDFTSVSFKAAEHTTEGDREGKITLTYGEAKKTITVKQTDSFPDPIAYVVKEITASALNGGAQWKLALTENDITHGDTFTRIIFNLAEKNPLHITSGTYSVANGGIVPGKVDMSGMPMDSTSAYRTNGDAQSITDAEFVVAIDPEAETTKIDGWFVTNQYDSATNSYILVKVSLKYEESISGMKYKEDPNGITEWTTANCRYSFDDAFLLEATAADGSTSVSFFLRSVGASKKNKVLNVGTYPVKDWVYTATENFCEGEGGGSKLNGSYLVNAGQVEVEAQSDGTYKFTFNVTNTQEISAKGIIVCAVN